MTDGDVGSGSWFGCLSVFRLTTDAAHQHNKSLPGISVPARPPTFRFQSPSAWLRQKADSDTASPNPRCASMGIQCRTSRFQPSFRLRICGCCNPDYRILHDSLCTYCLTGSISQESPRTHQNPERHAPRNAQILPFGVCLAGQRTAVEFGPAAHKVGSIARSKRYISDRSYSLSPNYVYTETGRIIQSPYQSRPHEAIHHTSSL